MRSKASNLGVSMLSSARKGWKGFENFASVDENAQIAKDESERNMNSNPSPINNRKLFDKSKRIEASNSEATKPKYLNLFEKKRHLVK